MGLGRCALVEEGGRALTHAREVPRSPARLCIAQGCFLVRLVRKGWLVRPLQVAQIQQFGWLQPIRKTAGLKVNGFEPCHMSVEQCIFPSGLMPGCV